MARAPKKQQPKPLPELASRIAARWAKSGGELALDWLVSELGDEQRYDIVAALKELEKAGAGTFEVGRAGRKARFSWSSKTATRKVAAPTAQQPQRLELAQRVKLAQKARPSSADLEHRFHLRPGLVVSVRLPVDVTATEVARFCQFLQAIPFEER